MRKKWLISILFLYLIIRIYIATLSSYGFYHGWNEGHYSIIAKNFFSGSLWEQIVYTGSPLSSVPPLFSYLVFISFKIFGISDLSARLVSIFSEVVAILGVYTLARTIYSEKIAYAASLIFLLIPWNILWFGRVQTDPLMTALITLAIALYVDAYKNNKSMMPFGLALGLAIFTKQPSLAVIPVILIWSYFEGVKKHQIKMAAVWLLAGLIPLMVWLSYYLLRDPGFISNFIYGELAYRSAPFSDITKVIAAGFAGISPVVFLLAFYEVIKMENKRTNPLIPWLIIFGIFILVRTPPSHEYYLLPITPVFAILAAKGVERFSLGYARFSALKKLTEIQIDTFFILILIISIIPFSYAVLSYSGELGYTATRDAGEYLNSYMDSHPQETFYIFTPSRYVPQVAWYSNLTIPGKSNRQVLGMTNELGNLDVALIEKMTPVNATVFLVTDDREGFADKLEKRYDRVFSSSYETVLPDISGGYTGERPKEKYFYQSIKLFRIR